MKKSKADNWAKKTNCFFLILISAKREIYYKELMNALEQAILHLPQKTQEIYRMSRYEYFTGREIVQRVGLLEKSVEYHISQALKL